MPQSWEWTRLGFLFAHNTGKALNSAQHSGTLLPYITTSNLYWDRFELGSTRQMYFTDTEIDKCTVQKGDLLVCEGGDFGRSSIWMNDYSICIQNHIHRLRAFYPICTRFFYYIFLLYKGIGNIGGKGIGIQGLSSGALHNIIVPLPSFQEQCRIVQVIDNIMPVVEKYEKSQDRLDTLNSEIKEVLRKSILQEAIQGKLIPQDPTDESAEELMKQIKVEKQKLLKEGKLKKKDVVDSIIFKGEDNKYYETINGKNVEVDLMYDYPKSWCIVRLQSICALLDGEKKTGDGICLDAKFLRGKSTGNHLQFGKFVSKGDNIILVDGENSGEVFSVPIDGYMGSTFKQLWICESLHVPYVLECIRFYKDELRNSKKGAAIPHLNKDIFRNLIIGIPPFNEQIRIVQKLNEINKYLLK